MISTVLTLKYGRVDQEIVEEEEAQTEWGSAGHQHERVEWEDEKHTSDSSRNPVVEKNIAIGQMKYIVC